MKRIYLDYNASTPIAPQVAESMHGFLGEHYGNPSSAHWAGVGARAAVEQARGQVARLLGCSPQAIEEIARLARERGILFHTDAAQSVGKIRTDVGAMDVDLLSVAGHKMYAPKGVGALYIRRGVRIEPLIHGAGHESGRRAGTENVLLDVGLGTAC